MSGRLHARMSSDHDHGSRRSRVSIESISSSSPRESIPPLPVKSPPRKVDPRFTGGTAEEYFDSLSQSTIETPLDTPLRGTLERRKTSSHGRSSRRSRDHSSRGHSSSARDLIRLLVNERDSKEAMTILHKTAERLELETQRANDAERRLQDAEDRWKMINQSRMQAQSDVARINEELRLYKLQLEAAQSQIARANDMIAQTDREKALAEDQAAKAKRQARKLEIETMVQKALDEGRKLGREQGMREGREQGYNAAVDDAYVRARVETNRRLDDFLQNELGPEFGIDDPYGDDELDDDEFLPQPGPSSAPGMPAPGMQMFEPQRRMPEPQRQMREPQRQMREPQRQMREPQREVDESERQMHDSERQMHEPRRRRSMHDSRQAGPSILDQTVSMANAPRSRRSHSTGLFGTIKRSIGRVGPRNADRNVEINHGAPDVGTIVEDAALYNLSSPLPSSATAQFSRARAPSPVPMPQPNFHPNPSEVPPISMMNRQQSPMHAPVEIPPEGYIPPTENGSILLPPPHELARAPPTPSQGNSPLLTNPSLSRGNPGPAPPPKEPVPRDFVYENPQRSSRHRYQRSVAESVASTNTSNLSIISPPGPVRSSAMQSRLSAIPEYDGRHSSPSGSMHQGDGSGFAPPGRPLSRTSMSRHGETDALGMNGVYQTASPGMVDESIYRRSDRRNADSNGPVLPGDMTTTFSPQSYRSGFSGPRRPSHVTTPAPLAPQAYSRPRINSGASDAGFDARSSRGRGSVAGSEYRSRPNTASNSVVGNLPEINIEPPSRSESLQSRKTIVPQDSIMSPRMSPYGQSELPGPSSDPGMPRGFVPMTPQAGEAGVPPPGFVPISPAAPEGAPLGFVPVMPTVPERPPPGFFPASSIVPEGAPPGFVPTSPVVPDGAPLGFVPISPVVPEGAPPGFIPVSPAGPEGAPPGFVPVSTTIPVNPLPSPSMSMTGALPVMARSAGGYSESHYNTTPRSRKVSFGRETDSGWDSRPAWDDNRSDAYSPRLVRPSDMSSRPVSPGLRRASRASFGGDPASVPIPPSVTPSIAYTGRSNSYNSSRRTTPGPGVARSASTRDESMRSPRMYPYAAPVGMPTPGAHSNPQLPGMPPVGLSSPYSRRLESYPDEEDRPLSPTESNYTLTTPPPASPARSVHSRLSAAASRASLFIPPDPVDAAAAVRPLGEFTDRDPSLRRSASRASMGSNRSYKKYDASEYVDPAMLASGQPSRLPEPTDSKKSKKSKKSKGKR